MIVACRPAGAAIHIPAIEGQKYTPRAGARPSSDQYGCTSTTGGRGVGHGIEAVSPLEERVRATPLVPVPVKSPAPRVVVYLYGGCVPSSKQGGHGCFGRCVREGSAPLGVRVRETIRSRGRGAALTGSRVGNNDQREVQNTTTLGIPRSFLNPVLIQPNVA